MRHIKVLEPKKEVNTQPPTKFDKVGGIEIVADKTKPKLWFLIKCSKCGFIFKTNSPCNPCSNCGFKPNCSEVDIIKKFKEGENGN